MSCLFTFLSSSTPTAPAAPTAPSSSSLCVYTVSIYPRRYHGSHFGADPMTRSPSLHRPERSNIPERIGLCMLIDSGAVSRAPIAIAARCLRDSNRYELLPHHSFRSHPTPYNRSYSGSRIAYLYLFKHLAPLLDAIEPNPTLSCLFKRPIQ